MKSKASPAPTLHTAPGRKVIIIDNPSALPLVPLDDIQPFQGDLKKPLTAAALDKLIRSILDHRLFIAKAIFFENGVPYTEDGHQTLVALRRLRDLGYATSEVVSYALIDGRMQEASRKLYDAIMIPYQVIVPQGATEEDRRKDAAIKLLQINSQYAIINPATTLFDALNFSDVEFDTLLSSIEIPGLSAADLEGLASGLQRELFQKNSDEIPEIPMSYDPITKIGDIYTLGCHRIMCDDCRGTGNIQRLVGGGSIDILFTDPPYGIDIVKGIRSTIGGAKEFGRVRQSGGRVGTNSKPLFKGTTGGKGKVAPRLYARIIGDDKPFDPAHLINLAPVAILFGANNYASKLPDTRGWIVWDKGASPDSTFSQCELAWTNKQAPVRRYYYRWSGMCREGDRKTELKDRIHPTQKPVGLIISILQDFKGATVMDLYLGSGSTLIACERMGRVCCGMEIDPCYVDLVVTRWCNFAGTKQVIRNGIEMIWNPARGAQEETA